MTCVHTIHGTGISTYMNGWFSMVNVGKYTIHGCYGLLRSSQLYSESEFTYAQSRSDDLASHCKHPENNSWCLHGIFLIKKKKKTSFNKVIALEKWCLGSFPFNAPPMLQGLLRTSPCNGKTLPTVEGPRKDIPGPGMVDANINFLGFAGCSLRIQWSRPKTLKQIGQYFYNARI